MSERDRLRAQMTLQVYKVATVEIPQILPLKRSEPFRGHPAPVQAIETASHVDRSPRIPVRLVHPHHLPGRVVDIHPTHLPQHTHEATPHLLRVLRHP
jgi:hypothetical protein